LYEQVGEGKKWKDPDFGATPNDKTGALSIYYDGTTPPGYIAIEEITWELPEVYLKNEDCPNPNPKFVLGDSSSNEVKQGNLGNCWFISAMSVLASQDDLIRGGGDNVNKTTIQVLDKSGLDECSRGIYPPIFHKFHKRGIYCIRFFKDFKWRYVVIDEYFPVRESELVFASCTNGEEIWVPIVEKAYSKLVGCYQATTSGNVDDGLVDMTGYACDKLKFSEKDYTERKEEIWDFFVENFKNMSLMGCSVTADAGSIESEFYINDEKSGIVKGHAYSLANILELKDPEMENPRKTHRLMLIRNPWGNKEWKFDWSNGKADEKFEQHSDKIFQFISELEADEQFDPFQDDGLFFMNYKSFRQVFDKVFVAINFPDEWWAVRYENQQWTNKNQSLMGEKGINKEYGQNVQYLIEPMEDIDLFVSLCQNDGRLKQEGFGEDGYARYPFAEHLIWTQMSIFELQKGQTRISTFAKNQVIPNGKSPIRQSADNSLRVKLSAGKRYVVVPAPKNFGTGAGVKYNLSFYVSCHLHYVNI
jgi:hypothetical protein